ncbi:flavin reductase family protein [Rhizobium sp. RU36D]|uniref:flavin reductase family protein n=1 Tax=Rhizobium sp. RU36D TaxID=1907415 RepID=UPI0009D8721C|nr:flavin reductase family protein [Rhizobium sp. RU36D]SMC67436.1 NADH-FMN oxidoreductase RutF, flavin reductase (DIM6/NTAB) family [Rhizobium sp. RU36D]
MFYETADNRHGLAHDPFKAIVAPRPIGWIGTRSADGVRNLAPYSFFNAISDRPKLVMFSSMGHKHSVANIEATGVFTTSLVGAELTQQMNTSSAAVGAEVDEFALAGLTPGEGRLVAAPYVTEAYAVLECRMTEIIRPKTLSVPSDSYVVFGEVVGIHISEAAITDGRLDMSIVRPLARMGYMDYSEASSTFELFRPQLP